MKPARNWPVWRVRQKRERCQPSHARLAAMMSPQIMEKRTLPSFRKPKSKKLVKNKMIKT